MKAPGLFSMNSTKSFLEMRKISPSEIATSDSWCRSLRLLVLLRPEMPLACRSPRMSLHDGECEAALSERGRETSLVAASSVCARSRLTAAVGGDPGAGQGILGSSLSSSSSSSCPVKSAKRSTSKAPCAKGSHASAGNSSGRLAARVRGLAHF